MGWVREAQEVFKTTQATAIYLGYHNNKTFSLETLYTVALGHREMRLKPTGNFPPC